MEDLTLDQNQVTDEEKKLSARIVELDEKEGKTDEEQKELEEKTEKRHSSFDKKIGTLTYRAKKAEEELAAKEARIKELEEKADKKEPEEPKIGKIVRETLLVGKDKFHTDKALRSMLDAGEITEDEAYTHQQTRLKKEAAEEAYQRIRTEDKKLEEQNTRKDDAKTVLEKYPQFDKNSDQYNPDDPLLKEATRIYETGYYANPKGLSKAIVEAKKILRDTGARIDNTSNLSLKSPTAPGEKEKEVDFTPEEEDNAIKFYRDVMNPATGRNYTATESIAKAKKAKTSRRIT